MQSQAAWKEILDDEDDILTELDLSDEHENGQIRLLVHQTAEPEIYVYDGSDTGLTVDFNKSLIKLSPVCFCAFVTSVHHVNTSQVCLP